MTRRFSRFPTIPAILLGLAIIASAGSPSDVSAVITLIGDRDAATLCHDPVSVATLRWLCDSTAAKNAGRRVSQSTRPILALESAFLAQATDITRSAIQVQFQLPSRSAHLYRLTDLPPPAC